MFSVLQRGLLCYFLFLLLVLFFFFFNDTATTEIYTLSLHDALPIWFRKGGEAPLRGSTCTPGLPDARGGGASPPRVRDRKSTRLNSSHLVISYAVFCLKKKTVSLLSFLDQRHQLAE